MKLIVGLGNPGSKYEKTRHNVGFMLIDKCAEEQRFALREGKGDYWIGESSAEGERILWLKPTTYMNLSGQAVRDVVQFYKITLQDILIVCDDVVLPLGKIRLRKEGSDGGQNGLKSVILELGSDQFSRLRIGVDHERRSQMDLADFVLSRFTKEEEPVVQQVVEMASKAVILFIQRGIDRTMNVYNGLTIQP